MKYLILIFSMVLSFNANAQTFVSKEDANAYFAKCIEQTDTRFSKDSQNMFCACTAARLTQFFTEEDNAVMTSPTDPNARLAMNKMIVNIYAPCMQEPTRDYHYGICLNNPQVGKLSKNPQGLCKCAADQIASHMATNGARQFEDILSRNPNVLDPMQALYDDPKFQTFAQSKLLGCLK